MEIDSELRSKETWLISDDGLWDSGIGLVLMGWGLTTLLRHPIWFVAAIMLAYFLVVMAGKEVITRPRMENFFIAEERLIRLSRGIRLVLGAIIGVVIFGALMFWVFDFGPSFNWVSSNEFNPIYFMFPLIMLALGYFSQNGFRYFFYAGFSLLVFLIRDYINISDFALVFSAALILTLTGIGLLIRFMVRYPKSKIQENVQL
jgi:hypothetical protein